MANDLATLTTKLSTALRDASNATWTSAELNDILTWVAARLFPRVSRELDPTAFTITLVADTTRYTVPAGMLQVSAVEWLNTDGDELGALSGQSWMVDGDWYASTLQLHIPVAIADQGGTLQLRGYGRYDLVTNLPPDDFVPLILAEARQEAYRRVGADRERFKAWLSRNQSQNVTINELLQFISDAKGEARELRALTRVWQRPVPGRQG